MQCLVKSVSSSFSKDLSHEAKAKDSTRKAKAKDSTLKAKVKTKDFKIVLEDPRGRGLVLEDFKTGQNPLSVREENSASEMTYTLRPVGR